MAATFAAPHFVKFIPYAPPEPRTAQRPPTKEARTCSPEWLDVDEMIKSLDERGDKFLDTLAATPPFDALNAGSQTANTQNVLEDIGYDERNNVTGDSGTVSDIATPSIILPPADDACGPQPAFREVEERMLERHDYQPESPRVMVDLQDDTVEDAVVQSVQMSECWDGTPLVDTGGVLQSADEEQGMGNARSAASKDAVDPGKQSSEATDDLDSEAARSPSQCSIAETGSPPPSDNSMFEAWPGTSFRDSSDEETEPRQPKRASRQRKQRTPYSRKQGTPSIPKGRGSLRVHKPMWPRRSLHGSSKRSRWAINTDGPQNPLGPQGINGALVPQKLSQINLRRLASGETFMAAIIQDERDVAALAYDQSVTLIKRSIGCNQEVDGLGIMSISLNSWLLTGFLRMVDNQHPQLPARSGCLANGEIDESPVESICDPYGEHAELDQLMDLHGAVSPDNDGSIEDDLQSSDDEKPRVITSNRKPPWTPKEEEILADLVDHKSWEEIGELLGRPPGGVSQHWRKMQLSTTRGIKLRVGNK